jgi:hypothetical protein
MVQTAQQYRDLLIRLVNGDFSVEEINKFSYLNDWIEIKTNEIKVS